MALAENTGGILKTPGMQAVLPFLNGGIAGMTATTCIQPIDMIKVRLQLAGEGMKASKSSAMTIARELVANGKVLDLYTGLSAGLLRQVTYTTARLGFFEKIMNRINSSGDVTFAKRAGAGLTAGGLAAMVGNPADLALIRMQSDGLKPPAQRANYTSVIDALGRIARTEGVSAWWSGAMPTIARAMALNLGQLAVFSEAKSRLTTLSPRARTLTASAIAGFFASFLSLPFDFIKTRLQRQTRQNGILPYKSMLHAFSKVAKEEGVLRFYRGFGTYCRY